MHQKGDRDRDEDAYYELGSEFVAASCEELPLFEPASKAG